tara:strand:+ start:4670 stop:4954 length:285 start_codon:yes stop_codon:yes gene_type:complete
MVNRYHVTIFATCFAIFFAGLIFLFPSLNTFLFSVEVIIIPIVYYLGYELLLEDRENKFDEIIIDIEDEIDDLERENLKLKYRLKRKSNINIKS